MNNRPFLCFSLGRSNLLRIGCGRTLPTTKKYLEGLLELAMVVLLGRCATVRLESLNASIRRLLRVLSNQVKKPDLATLSSLFVCSRFRLQDDRAKLRNQTSAGKVKRRRTSTKGVIKRKCSKKHGGGGAWRAYVSLRCRGIRKACFRSLSRDYRNLPPGEKDMLLADGFDATAVNRRGEKSFGEKPSKPPTVAEQALALWRSGVRVAAVQPVKATGDRRLLAMGREGFAEKMKLAKVDARVRRRLQALQSKEYADTLSSWRQGPCGGGSLNTLATALPVVANHLVSVLPRPLPRSLEGDAMFSTFSVWRCPLKQLLPRIVALVAKHEPFQRLREAAINAFKIKHVVKHHADQQQFEKHKRRAGKKIDCQEAGVCICGRIGDRAWFFKRRLEKLIKDMYFGLKKSKDFLKSTMVVLCLSGEEQEAQPDMMPTEAFWCIATLDESPFDITFRKLTWPGRRITDQGHYVLKSTHVYKALLELVLESEWPAVATSVRFFEIFNAARPVPEVDPSRVEVVARGAAVVVRPKETRTTCAWEDELEAFDSDGEHDSHAEEPPKDADEELDDVSAASNGNEDAGDSPGDASMGGDDLEAAATPRSMSGSRDSILGGDGGASSAASDSFFSVGMLSPQKKELL